MPEISPRGPDSRARDSSQSDGRPKCMAGTIRTLCRWFAVGLLCLLPGTGCSGPRPELVHLDSMVVVPAGSFLMGVDHPLPDEEGPQHAVYLTPFRIDTHEVTNTRYQRCVEDGACQEPKDLRYYADPSYADHPVVFVSWFDAVDYCEWAGRRLPSEAEWEKAARGDQALIFPWGNTLQRDRLNADNRVGATLPVGRFPEGSSPYGALDMAGNVWEWVDDWFEPYPGSTFNSEFFDRKYKVVRGGSWNHPAEDARTDHRDIAHPARTMAVVGFRCASSME